jgi:phosphatidylserine/phosphatidylglycerophosphate/cardiolipin synthase-like enzyme
MNNFLVSCVIKWLHLCPDLVQSQLYDETTFYQKFREDLRHCKKEVIIESPYISTRRMYSLIQPFQGLVNRKVKVYVITRDPNDHDLNMKQQAEEAIRNFEAMGVQVLINSDYSHRKLAILDREILWEGSLNILSQTDSREIMRRMKSKNLAEQMFSFINLGKFIY